MEEHPIEGHPHEDRPVSRETQVDAPDDLLGTPAPLPPEPLVPEHAEVPPAADLPMTESPNPPAPESVDETPNTEPSPLFAPLDLELSRGVRVELLLSRDHERPGTHPFVRLGDDGLYANVYLARVATAAGHTLRYLALKIQRDAYDNESDARGSSQQVVTNTAIEDLWNNEYQRLRAFATHPGAPPVVRMIEFVPGDASGKAFVFEPLLFSRRRKTFHPIPCPEGEGHLTDCTDDALLARYQLAEYGETNVRYLYSPGQVERHPDQTPTFYRLHPSEREEERSVLGLDGLLRRLVETERLGPLAASLEGSDAAKRSLDERVEALLDDLIPLSFHRFRAFPLEVHRLRYHEFAACLGGIGWREFLETYRGREATEADALLLNDLEQRLERRGGWLFAGDTTGREAVEILRLKIALFHQVVEATRHFHERFGEPHLDLRPDNILVDLPEGHAEFQYLWNFRATLIDVAGTTRTPLDDGTSIARPPANFHELYTSPIISGIQFGHLHRGDLMIEDLHAEEAGIRVRLRVRSDVLDPRDHTPGDTLRFTFRPAGLGARIQFWARLKGAQWADDGHELIVDTLPTSLNERARNVLEGMRGKWQQNTPYEMYHAIGFACDVHSLGVLLFQTLLVNRTQRMGDVRRDFIDAIAAHVTRYEKEHRGASHDELRELVLAHVSDNPIARMHHVHHDADRERPNAIPTHLWNELLVLGLRMVTNVPGFSYCEHRSDPPAGSGTPLSTIANDLAGLASQLHTALFSRQGIHEEIHEALERLRKQS